MTQSKTIFAAAALFALAVTAVGFVAAPFNTAANASVGSTVQSAIEDRIGGAFSVIGEDEMDDVVAVKGDLPISQDCAAQTWPNVSSNCIVTEDGTPAPDVRFVTVAYQAGETETVLLRLPANVTVH